MTDGNKQYTNHNLLHSFYLSYKSKFVTPLCIAWPSHFCPALTVTCEFRLCLQADGCQSAACIVVTPSENSAWLGVICELILTQTKEKIKPDQINLPKEMT